MLELPPALSEPKFSRPARIVGLTVGSLSLTAGGVAVFQTDNELGSAALVAAGVVIAALTMLGNHIEVIEAGGVRLQLERQARHARQEAEEARAGGEIDRAEELEQRAQKLLVTAKSVGSRYQRIRTTEPSGWDRTSRLEALLKEARSLDTTILTAADVADIFAGDTDGDRITALAFIESSPALASAEILVDAITESRSHFEQYHALVAAEAALDHLRPEAQAQIRTAVESVLAGPLGERHSDRRKVARRILERLEDPRDG